jgi:hypothetical protein
MPDYIAHHNGPQYFGYEANNPGETKAHLKGLGDFFTAISANALPSEPAVSSTSAAGMATSMAWFLAHPARRSRPLSRQ